MNKEVLKFGFKVAIGGIVAATSFCPILWRLGYRHNVTTNVSDIDEEEITPDDFLSDYE